MPLALWAALAGSLLIHLAGLFGADVEFFGGGAGPDPIPLQAEIRPPPAVPAPEPAPVPEVAKPAAKPPVKRKPVKPAKKPAPRPILFSAQPVPVLVPVAPVAIPENVPEISQNLPSTAAILPAPVKAILPASGTIRFAIVKESLGFQVGRAEHHWEFTEDGHYKLSSVTETSGLVAVFKPVRMRMESRGRLVAGGLQPDTLRSLKNGQDSNENADFSWSTAPDGQSRRGAAVTLSRDGSVQSIAPGTQDILSLNYQLAYLRDLDGGVSIGVVTGKKYERYALDSFGEEEIDTPAGHFRTLHLRAMTDSTTEIWIALDHGRLPVKIRFTDKKGESFEQVATEIGMP